MEAKPVIVAGAFVGIVIVVVILFTSFQSGWDNNPGGLGMKTASTINLENGSPALGSESSPVTIVEFGDYQCEACYHWFHNTRDTLIDNYIEPHHYLESSYHSLILVMLIFQNLMHLQLHSLFHDVYLM